MIRSNRPLISAAAFAALGLNGATFAFVGTSLPAIRTYLAIDPGQAALLTAVMQGGFTGAALVGGLLSDTIRCEKVLMYGCFFLSIGSFFLGAGTDYLTNLAMMLLIGIGVGFIVSSSNALLVSMYRDRKGLILNIHHVFFGIGSLAAPLIMGVLLSRNGRWQNGYLGLSILMALLCLFFSRTGLQTDREHSLRIFTGHIKELLSDHVYLLISVTSALAIGTQFALMLLLVSFLTEVKSLSIADAGLALSLFFTCLVAGRLVCSRLSLFLKNTTIIFALLLLQSVAIVSIWLGDARLSPLFAAVSGLACSGLYPCFLALTGSLYFRVAGSALGILTTTAGLGGFIICWLTGVVSGRADLGRGFAVPVLSSIAALLLFASSHRLLNSREEQPQTTGRQVVSSPRDAGDRAGSRTEPGDRATETGPVS